ncbi:MAG: glutamate synthase-related protein [Syntrophales bacterium]|nr:glutamate synthase-related protein [Syntrophales bacterium]
MTRDAFLKEVARLRKVGFKRVTLKTGAYSAVELAMALRYGAEAEIDLLTIDGAPGGTGMSPWPMMCEWGIPSFHLHSLTYQFCEELRKKKIRVPDIAFAGGFSTEDGIFKAIALGAPYVKAVCMGRALMIPGMVGKNIGEWIKKKELPKTVSKFGTTIEEIFVGYEDLKKKLGKEIDKLPTGALGLYTFSQKFKVGLQQLMAGSRNFNLSTIARNDIMALTEESSRISGIPFVMDAYVKEAKKILAE